MSTGYKKSIFSYFGTCALYAALGILLGVLINTVTQRVTKRFKLGPWQSLTGLFALNVAGLYVIETYVSEGFAIDWQGNTPGLLFIATLFGSQLIMASELPKIAETLYQ